jgi:hypothetical protein
MWINGLYLVVMLLMLHRPHALEDDVESNNVFMTEVNI